MYRSLRGNLSKAYLLFLLALSFLLFEPSWAGPARARWVNSQHMWVKLPQGLLPANNLSFVLANSANNLRGNAVTIRLPVILNQDRNTLLSTAHISLTLINDLIHRPTKLFILNNSGQVLDSTAIQYAGLLDELYRYDQNDLGLVRLGSHFQAKVWAPTASSVRLLLYERADQEELTPSENIPMSWNQGVWTLSLPLKYLNYFYLYEVTVYHPLTDRIETLRVTDPYSFSLSTNATKSHIVDLQNEDLKPQGWEQLQKPALNSFKDIVLYELHIRDFSADDASVPFPYRGSYLAFTLSGTKGTQHLQSLSDAGVTHIHLLPFNDFASVDEDKNNWESLNSSAENLQDTQAALAKIRTQDGFNWGYDPVHYFAPDGSYSTHAEDATRIKEVRAMVQSLNTMGLRVVQDVVFNHTYASGLGTHSVLDKIVPLYYYRLDDEGNVLKSSCCDDTASEHHMMEKLMIDAVLHWARTYKIDGFRFDLMSFHSRETLIKIKEAVRSLTLVRDGVDGSKIFLYGEGWPFGSLYDQDPTNSMTQINSYGTGIGQFNDRLRDAVRGGTTNSSEKSDQGFATGLFFDFNKEPANKNTPPNLPEQREKLLHLGDVIKVGLAGNLRDYVFREHLGTLIPGGNLNFRSVPVGTAAQAIETINYVSAHDGYTLWDAIQAKAPFYTAGRNPPLASVVERQRMHQLAMAIPLLSQGIPFIEAGTELLRSKNGDQNSYDSGDFFNRLDWSRRSNHWGEGLPPAWGNFEDWSFWQPRLETQDLKADSNLIEQTNNYFKALLRVRRSTQLFKMNEPEEIHRGVFFIDNEGEATPGLIAMVLRSQTETLLIVFNASRDSRVFTHPILRNPWTLHPLLTSLVDPALNQVILRNDLAQIQIPGLSTVILKLTQPAK